MLDITTKENIILYLSQWIEIVRIEDRDKYLVIEGRQRDTTSLRKIARNSRNLISSIKKISTGSIDRFIVKPGKIEKRIPTVNLV
ncbi:MAG TPA: hypothetical protein PLB60_08840, partial [Candidatus Marinimicrobia bacterium]|nr:hypothetical protein [Candidatus Neomarinimicrobiota bacterium]